MTRDEIITILKILKTAYPRFYNNMSKNEAEDTINLWLDMFRNERPDLVIGAVKNLINHFSYPPTIADVKNEIFNALDVKGITATEAWNLTRAAIHKSAYDSKEEFDKLPKEAQRIVGAPSQLKQTGVLTATIMLNINAITTAISGSNYVKWAVTTGDTASCSATAVKSGNFKGKSAGNTITLYENIPLTVLDESNTNSAPKYTVWVWVDSAGGATNNNLSGETIDVNVWTQINMNSVE